MSATREKILRTALELSESDRLLLATELMETVAEDLPGWCSESVALLDELETRAQDGAPGIRWETVKNQLRADLEL